MKTVEPIRDLGQIEDIGTYLKNQSERNYMLFEFGIYVGIRISDILQLQAKDVRGKEAIYIREKKTGKEKEFDINPEFKPMLDRYVHGMKDYEYLFTNANTGRPITRQQAYNIIAAAGAYFGIEHLGTHTLRKTYGYWHYKFNNDIACLQEQFNHSDPSVTLRYIGIKQDTRRKENRKISYRRRH